MKLDKNVTEIIFLLDRSGSMAGLEEDTIGGFNSFIKTQSQQEGDTILTTILFDDKYEVLWSGVKAKDVVLTEKEYYVRGMTALLDAVGKTIIHINQRLKITEQKNKVIFVITTDGMENASKEFTYDKVNRLIKKQQEDMNWEFLFLGANIDVAKEADKIGINSNNAIEFEASNEGIVKMYSTLNETVLNFREK